MRYSIAGLLAAMLITAVVGLSLLPLARSTQAALAVEQGAEQLARELQAARQLALASGDTYQVSFDRSEKAYFVKCLSAFVPARRIDLPPGVEWVSMSTNPIEFYGTGRCPTGGTVSLRYRGAYRQIEVIIATHSGRVRLRRVNP